MATTQEQLMQLAEHLGLAGGAAAFNTQEGIQAALFIAFEKINRLELEKQQWEKDKGDKEKSSSLRGLNDLVSNKGIIQTDKFSGAMKDTEFRAWAYTLKSTIRSKDRELGKMMDEAEKLVGNQNPIKDMGALLSNMELVEKSEVLHAILLNVVKMESEPFKLLENNDARGVECWRLFHRRWSRSSPMTSIDVIEKIREIGRAKTTDEMNPKLQQLMTLVQDWERTRSTGGLVIKYDDVVLKADYFRIMPESWCNRFKVDAELDYMYCDSAAVLEKIELYIRTYSSGSAPMDLSIMDQRSAPDDCNKEEPESWPVDIGAMGEVNPDILCWTCGGKGHPKSKCPWNWPKGKGKGGKGGKGFGKNGGKDAGKGYNGYGGKDNGKGGYNVYGGYKGYQGWGTPYGGYKGGGKKGSPKGGKPWNTQPWTGGKGKGKQAGPTPMDVGGFNSQYSSDFSEYNIEPESYNINNMEWGYEEPYFTGGYVGIYGLEARTRPEKQVSEEKKPQEMNEWKVKVSTKKAGDSQKMSKRERKMQSLIRYPAKSAQRGAKFFQLDMIEEEEDEYAGMGELCNCGDSEEEKYMKEDESSNDEQEMCRAVKSMIKHHTVDRNLGKSLPKFLAGRGDCGGEQVECGDCDISHLPAADLRQCSWQTLPEAKKDKDIAIIEVKYRPQVAIGAVAVENDWFEIPGGLTIDSGAAESVMPEGWCDNYNTKVSEQQQAGVYYVTASGEELDNKGEKSVDMTLTDGRQFGHTFQVTDVSKPLGSVSRICESGQQVVFNPPGHPDGNYIRNLGTGLRSKLDLINGTYKLKAWVNPARARSPSTFTGPGA